MTDPRSLLEVALLEAANALDAHGYDHEAKAAREAREELTWLRGTVARAAYVAENLFGMIDPQAWRDTGGDDGQGHYEGDYRAEQVHAEIVAWKEIAK